MALKFVGKKGMDKGAKDLWKKLTGSLLGIIVLIIIIIAIVFGVALVTRELLLYHVYSVYTKVQNHLNLTALPFDEQKTFWKENTISEGKYSGNPIYVFQDIIHLFNIKKDLESKLT